MKYIISIDRSEKSWAVFTESFTPMTDFARYETEDEAIRLGKQWVSERTSESPDITYPRITSFRAR